MKKRISHYFLQKKREVKQLKDNQSSKWQKMGLKKLNKEKEKSITLLSFNPYL